MLSDSGPDQSTSHIRECSEKSNGKLLKSLVISQADDKNDSLAPLVVRLRGCPFETNEEIVREFFSGLDIVEVQFTYNEHGRTSGECFVRFSDEEYMRKALGIRSGCFLCIHILYRVTNGS